MFVMCVGMWVDVWECEKLGNVVFVVLFEMCDVNEVFYVCEWCVIDLVG